MQNWRTSKVKKLAVAFKKLKTEEEILAFLRDLCTLDELDELSSRLEAANLLQQGIPYREISKRTGMSTTTVSRIAWWLEHGEGGYKKVLK